MVLYHRFYICPLGQPHQRSEVSLRTLPIELFRFPVTRTPGKKRIALMNRLRCAIVRRFRLLPALLMIAFLGLIAGCDSDESTTDPSSSPSIVEPTIDSVSVPEYWVYESLRFRDLHVYLSLPDEQFQAIRQGDMTAPTVLVSISELGIETPNVQFAMYDDGGNRELDAPLAFQDNHSGDLVPLDLVYSGRMNATFAELEGQFQLVFTATWQSSSNDNQKMTTLTDTVLVEVNSPPVISNFSYSDSLHAGFEEQVWSVTVADPDVIRGDAVDEVQLLLIGDDTSKEYLFTPAGGDNWTFTLRASFAASKPTAEYTVQITASDRYNQAAEPLERLVWIENTAPMISDLATPDTVYRPEGDNPPPNLYDMFITVDDLQGQEDIDVVNYIVIDPNGGITENNDFVFNDLGDEPDAVAHDGRWGHRFQVPSSVSNFGTYGFIFTAYDLAGNRSEDIYKAIELLNTGGK